jgi:hypothetical protein
VILALAAAGCAGTTGLAGSPEADRRVARRALADAAAAGPVPLVVAGDPGPLAAADLPALAARGVRGLDPRFEPASSGGAGAPRLVLWFDPPPGAGGAQACGADALGAAPAGVPGLLAAWCEGAAPAASVSGEAAAPGRAEAERLVWRATARLFPDDYADSYGFDLFGLRVGLGGSFGF